MHAPLLGDAALAGADWLNRESPLNQGLIGQLYAGFVDRYGDEIAPAHREVCERLVGGVRRLPRARGGVGSRRRVWCTATTGWTTCCSARTAPTVR